MPDPKTEPAQVIPAVKGNLTRSDDPAIYQAIRRESLPKKSLEDLNLERVSFTYKDGEGALRTLTPIIDHASLNQFLTFLEDAEIG
jgi:hypothetical protein